MPSAVTIHCRPYTPVAFPPICCVCLAQATTTYPVHVWMYKVRYPPTMKVTWYYALPVPYCDAHGDAARALGRYDRVAAIVLGIVSVVALIGIDLTIGRMLRELSGVMWWVGIVLLIALLVFSSAVLHQLGRRMLQQRYLAPANHLSEGSLGVATTAHVRQHASRTAAPMLAITFTFANDTFAAQVAALHGVEVARIP